jgi:hypothetical protein
MSNPSKRKGSQFETDLVKYFRVHGFDAERLPRTGAKDEGDVLLRLNGLPFVVEAKATRALDLAGWTAEALNEAKNWGESRNVPMPNYAVIHKRRNAPIALAYVTIPLYEWLGQVSDG